MLILSCCPGKAVMIGDEIVLRVLEVNEHQGHVKLGIEAPVFMTLRRQEALPAKFNQPPLNLAPKDESHEI